MNSQNTEATVGIKNLKVCLEALIDQYQEAQVLLEDQIQAVIDSDITSLNRLVEKQVVVYDTLKKAEGTFKKQIQSFRNILDENEPPSLQNLIARLNEPTETLASLRIRLRTQVQKTERLHGQVVNLLQFARQQNADFFQSICMIASNATEGYDATGKKMKSRSHGLAINQQA